MLNKPRGLVTTTRDEQGRDTVYRCLEGAGLPWLAPVGRLDKASEGLLLFSNDPKWAARMTNPATGPDKTYHVQIDRIADEALAAKLARGTTVDGELLCAKRARCLRHGQKNAWIEIILDEGRNRQIRRLLGAFDIAVLRLVRVSVGDLQLGDLPKGAWRIVTQRELESLAPPLPLVIRAAEGRGGAGADVGAGVDACAAAGSGAEGAADAAWASAGNSAWRPTVAITPSAFCSTSRA